MDGAVVLTAHPSREGLRTNSGYSGSTAWFNGVRSLLYLTQPTANKGDPHARELRHLKANMGPLTDPTALRWRAGAFVPEHEPGGPHGAMNDRSVERDFLGALDKLVAQGKHVTDARNSPRYAPKMMRERLKIRHSKHALEEAMFRLFNAGELISDEVRMPNRHMASVIVRAPRIGSQGVR